MQEKKTQNPSLSVTHETMHGNQWKRTEKQRAEPQCEGKPSQRAHPLGPATSLSREQLTTESWGREGVWGRVGEGELTLRCPSCQRSTHTLLTASPSRTLVSVSLMGISEVLPVIFTFRLVKCDQGETLLMKWTRRWTFCVCSFFPVQDGETEPVADRKHSLLIP